MSRMNEKNSINKDCNKKNNKSVEFAQENNFDNCKNNDKGKNNRNNDCK